MIEQDLSVENIDAYLAELRAAMIGSLQRGNKIVVGFQSGWDAVYGPDRKVVDYVYNGTFRYTVTNDSDNPAVVSKETIAT